MDRNEYLIRKATDEEYEYWMNISTIEQAKDRAYVNETTYDEELVKLKQVLPMLLPEGINTKEHHFNVLNLEEAKDIGFIWFGKFPGIDEDTIILLEIILKEEYRSKGLGRRLLTDMHKQMKDLGYKKIFLSVLKKNHAKKLYESLGYELIKDYPKSKEMILEL